MEQFDQAPCIHNNFSLLPCIAYDLTISFQEVESDFPGRVSDPKWKCQAGVIDISIFHIRIKSSINAISVSDIRLSSSPASIMRRSDHSDAAIKDYRLRLHEAQWAPGFHRWKLNIVSLNKN